MKKIKLLCLSCIIAFGLTGCSEISVGEPITDDFLSNMNTLKTGMYEWVSPDGVHYWIYIGTNYSYGMTPRYDNNGNLIID